jgi:hypothetical protein
MRRLLGLIIIVCSTMVLLACQSPTPPPASTPIVEGGTPAAVATTAPQEDINIAFPSEMDSETGILRGRIVSVTDTLPLTNTVVMLAEVTRQGEQGAFVLNTAQSPATLSDVDGYFFVVNVKPGEYVLVVGDPSSGGYEIIQNVETGKPQTYFIEAGNVTEVGELQITATIP